MTTSKERPRAAEMPSDLELMAYFDGELEEPRKSAVAAFLGESAQARNKLAGLSITSGVVRSRPLDLSAADDIADLVMAKIAADPAESAPTPPAKVVPLRTAAATPARLPPAKPANDNVRRILGVAALAVAAAAALTLWGRQNTGPGGPATQAPVALSAPSSASPSPDRPAASTPAPATDATSVAASAETDAEHGVEVAAVNFGAHMGSIFYVPSGSIEANRTTTVVWLADDAGE